MTIYLSLTDPDRPAGAIPAKKEVAENIARYEKYTLNTYARPPIVFKHGKGCKIYDQDGKQYIDFTAGIAVNALGHADDQVAAIIADQAAKLIHLSNLYYNEWAGHLAQSLVRATLAGAGTCSHGLYRDVSPEGLGPKVFFSNSGTEANEGALKFARKYGKLLAASGKLGSGVSHGLKTDPNLKYNIVSFTRGFHGRSMGALSVTTNPKYQDPFTPLIPGIVHARYNMPSEVAAMVDERTCAVIVEPIQGEGGVHAASVEFLRTLRRRCDQVGAVLIYDEIQCGLGRTGKFWAHHHYPADCAPDIITLAKPLANGLPIGGIIVSHTIADLIKIGDHGTTFGGNPLACRVGHNVVSRISDNQFLASVQEKGEYLKHQIKSRLGSFIGADRIITETRGTGLIQGLQFDRDPSSIVSAALDRGLLLVSAGGNAIRLIPPLVVSKDEIDQGVSILVDVLKSKPWEA
ncbi:acetylornithine aminotransferase [Spiromyces aspiralis]|uniref:Acetylornithine aminotransferase n=1 Tax=Spiromyces aspiralis TaxID=68401 RepID=A0ACC1HZ64_9FUNG|nr:acetylornithine aminotransferase [Spiromyces aspiralis]